MPFSCCDGGLPSLHSGATAPQNPDMQPRQPLSSEPEPFSPGSPFAFNPTDSPVDILQLSFADIEQATAPGIRDRAELIERIKAGESPTWVPSGNQLSDRYYPNHTPTSVPRLTDSHPDRPQPALHQGIFACEARSSPNLVGSPPVAPTLFTRFNLSARSQESQQTSPPVTPTKRLHHIRTPSLSSSFVFKTPTSPLVHSSNTDTDGHSDDSLRSDPIDISFTEQSARRRSLPPFTLSTLQLSTPASPTLGRHNGPSDWGHGMSPPALRHIRRPSGLGGASSELPFGSFVGSYEESILNGRMSTTPSKPLNFVAQVGVLGLGKCKQSLRCPAHVTIPFPAYFYCVRDYDSPSPYVGQVDLDSALGSQSSQSKRFPPGVGGSYRIPQRGQLQIVIKNPNKTAVKLFLVPYDLRDMEPGTKTFIRQKAYSVGEVPDADVPVTVPLSRQRGKDSLRYLIHLHIVCPSRGRYYIFRSIRVVFANRVPDGKERLRNEILRPEPKYSPWKPESSSTSTTPTANRRRSASLYGMQERHRVRTPPPPLPFQPTTPSPVEYKKQALPIRLEDRGLLARELGQLGVEGEL